MPKNIKILFLGDIVGRPGRNVVAKFLKDAKYDFVIANAENASHGFGLTEKNYNELLAMGINCLTSGNHIWDKADIYKYIESASALVRPLNYPKGAKGVGCRVFGDFAVVNLLGRTFMNPVNCPFRALEEIFPQIESKIVIVDFHAEATAEKISMGYFASKLGVAAVLGTHTHVQTADEKIIENTAYVTDVGFCGALTSVIGMDVQTSLNRILTSIPSRFDVAKSPQSQLNAVEITFCKGKAHKILRINKIFEEEK